MTVGIAGGMLGIRRRKPPRFGDRMLVLLVCIEIFIDDELVDVVPYGRLAWNKL